MFACAMVPGISMVIHVKQNYLLKPDNRVDTHSYTSCNRNH